MKPGASLLLAEPAGHVKKEEFDGELAFAAQAGLAETGRPSIPRSQTTLFKKP
jgi:hypothetical protein